MITNFSVEITPTSFHIILYVDHRITEPTEAQKKWDDLIKKHNISFDSVTLYETVEDKKSMEYFMTQMTQEEFEQITKGEKVPYRLNKIKSSRSSEKKQ